MTRKERRKLKKDKSLVCNLYNIIDKYLPKLFTMFDELSDQRQQGKVNYPMKVICINRLFGLLCGIATMNDLTIKFKNNITTENISNIFNTNLEK